MFIEIVATLEDFIEGTKKERISFINIDHITAVTYCERDKTKVKIHVTSGKEFGRDINVWEKIYERI